MARASHSAAAMTTWKKRGLGALVLVLGMATTIATSPIEHLLTDTAEGAYEAGEPTTLIALIDSETLDEGRTRLRYQLTVSAEEDFGAILLDASESESLADGMPVRWESEPAPDGGFQATAQEWSVPFQCFSGHWCSRVLTFETELDVPYQVTVTADADRNMEFPEDAVFLVDLE